MIVLAAIFLILLLVLLLPIKVKIAFSEKFDFTVKFLSFTVFDSQNKALKKSTKISEEADTSKENNKESTDVLKILKTYFDIVMEILKILYKYLKSRLRIKEFNFRIAYGLDDAAATGIFSGAVYTVVYSFYAYILNNFTVNKHNVKIEPDFDNSYLKIEFLLKFNISILWLLCLLFHERKAIDKLLKIIKKDGANNG